MFRNDPPLLSPLMTSPPLRTYSITLWTAVTITAIVIMGMKLRPSTPKVMDKERAIENCGSPGATSTLLMESPPRCKAHELDERITRWERGCDVHAMPRPSV